jgi:transposase-like protein
MRAHRIFGESTSRYAVFFVDFAEQRRSHYQNALPTPNYATSCRKNGTDVTIRQCKYLNNIVEQDHRAVKRRTRPIMGFKDFRSARIILGGIEVMHMIRKGQMVGGKNRTPAEQFYSLAA